MWHNIMVEQKVRMTEPFNSESTLRCIKLLISSYPIHTCEQMEVEIEMSKI